eukprot:2549852-Rhodomonas_salina.1
MSGRTGCTPSPSSPSPTPAPAPRPRLRDLRDLRDLLLACAPPRLLHAACSSSSSSSSHAPRPSLRLAASTFASALRSLCASPRHRDDAPRSAATAQLEES